MNRMGNINFTLNDYHRNVSDEDLIKDVINVAEKLKTTTLTLDEYSKNGKFHSSTLTRRFGSWKKVLELAHLDIKNHNFKLDYSDADLIADVIRVKSIYKKETITSKEYDVYGNYHSSTLINHGKPWNKILEMAGLKVNLNRNFTNEEMFKEIERIWTKLGRQPTTTDIKKGISKYSLQSYSRRFGGWRGTLQAFVNYINANTENIENEKWFSLNKQENTVEDSNFQHITNRDVNLRLRFKVFQRDNFKCCICGASPAKNPDVELHVDHIIPWSKGGETVLENLQTLCSKCNLGKSDLL